MTNETTKPSWDEYQDISNTLTQLLGKGYTKSMIKTVLEQLRLEQQPRWTPVSESSPKDNSIVLVTFENGFVGISSWHKSTKYNNGFDNFLYGFKEGTVFSENCDVMYGVIAWMPLPEPYKAESEEKK